MLLHGSSPKFAPSSMPRILYCLSPYWERVQIKLEKRMSTNSPNMPFSTGENFFVTVENVPITMQLEKKSVGDFLDETGLF
jgi:hypothetical protein